MEYSQMNWICDYKNYTSQRQRHFIDGSSNGIRGIYGPDIHPAINISFLSLTCRTGCFDLFISSYICKICSFHFKFLKSDIQNYCLIIIGTGHVIIWWFKYWFASECVFVCMCLQIPNTCIYYLRLWIINADE